MVEPRPGGNFTLGARGCAEAPNDGYTICMLNNEALAYNEFLYKKIPYNPAKDFAPITNLLFITTALVVNSSLQVKTLDELAALAKARPKTLAFVAPSMHQRLFFDRFNKSAASILSEFRSRAAVMLSPASCPARRRSASSGWPASCPTSAMER